MKLLIAIPALNEEDSIEQIIKRTLEARSNIIQNSFIDQVEITVVSDGSTDETVNIASQFKDQVNLIVFEKNRGYGAAIKRAWRESDAEVLGFLDADGTCDPNFFASLCRVMEAKEADIVLGCRINARSKMPLVRRIGNAVYAAMLTVLSSTRVKDTASGMRVVKRDCIPKLFPLPDGLHFTPAMSARALLSQDLSICEIDMPYEEREGESKLSLWKDGIRFLRVIIESAWTYCPSRFFDFGAMFCILFAGVLMMKPSFHYVSHQSLEEWMIYRFMVSNLFIFTGCLLFCIGHLSRKVVEIAFSNKPWRKKKKGLLTNFFQSYLFWVIILILFFAGSFLVFPSLIELIQTGHTSEHWSRFLVMMMFYSVAIILMVTRALIYTLDLIAARVTFLRSSRYYSGWFRNLKDQNRE